MTSVRVHSTYGYVFALCLASGCSDFGNPVAGPALAETAGTITLEVGKSEKKTYAPDQVKGTTVPSGSVFTATPNTALDYVIVECKSVGKGHFWIMVEHPGGTASYKWDVECTAATEPHGGLDPQGGGGGGY